MNIISRNNVKITGKGEKTMVLAHGFACDQNIWKSLLPYFEQEYRIVLFDYVGSGQSDSQAYQPEKYKDLYGYAQDLLDVLEAVKTEQTIFVGHSVSGMIGMLASLQKPAYFEKIIMIGASPRYINEEPDYHGGFNEKDVRDLFLLMEMNFIGWASMSAPMFMNNPERPQLAEKLASAYTAENPVIMRQFAEATFFSDHRQDLALMAIPSLLLQCAEDSVVPLEIAHYLHKHLKNSKLALMSARGHYPQLSQPDETARLIKSYLSESMPN
jgi:sigma-B regulation protein RsbQ